MYSDGPYWRPPDRLLSMVFQLETDGLETRFWRTNNKLNVRYRKAR
jgi:hypothetical protein